MEERRGIKYPKEIACLLYRMDLVDERVFQVASDGAKKQASKQQHRN